jgi:hypothetical protein
LKDPGVDGRKILKWTFDMLYGGHKLDRSGSGSGQVAGSCECGDEPSSSIKCGEFLEQLRAFWLLRKDSSSTALISCIYIYIYIYTRLIISNHFPGAFVFPLKYSCLHD